MKNNKYILILLFHIFFANVLIAQSVTSTSEFDPEPRGDNGFRIMFYNVENLFDTFDDPAINDEEFTSNGEKGWSYYRYKEKLNHIAKTIIAVGGWEAPALIGLCEIENFQVLMDLITKTPLKKYGYQIVHENSNDKRGIDVALLFRPDKLLKIAHISIKIEDNTLVTRDILYASFSYQQKDTVHFYVNHWPSRYGGKSFSESKRIKVASVLKSNTDSLLKVYRKPKILVMGDFNDDPSDESLSLVLDAMPLKSSIIPRQLYNLSFKDFRLGKGTLVYKEIDHTWFLFDQMIVSGALIEGAGLLTKGRKTIIYKSDWLLKNGRPFRTYQGPIYKGGFSDHLPIFIDLYFNSNNSGDNY